MSEAVSAAEKEYFPTFIVHGPCKVAVNVGGKKFRTFYRQLQKGLIQAESGPDPGQAQDQGSSPAPPEEGS